MRAVVDDHVDRPQVGARRRVEPSGTNGPESLPGGTRVRRRASGDGYEAHKCDNEIPLSFPVHAGSHEWRPCAGAHLFPCRTEKLSPAAAMILRASVGK